jgi:hypothetical protein
VPGSASALQDGMPGAFPVAEGSSFAVDQTKPTTSVQVRLADGTRFVQSALFLLTYCDCG